MVAPMQHHPGQVIRRTCLIGGAASFAVQLRPKLMRWGLDVQQHFTESYPPAGKLPAGFDVYLVLYDVTRHANHNLRGWKIQAQNERLLLISVSRKESTWSQEFERAGIQKLAPVTAAALNNEQAGERTMPIAVTERKITPTKEQRREELFASLESIIAELRRDHSLETLMMGEDGKIVAEVVTRETISR